MIVENAKMQCERPVGNLEAVRDFVEEYPLCQKCVIEKIA